MFNYFLSVLIVFSLCFFSTNSAFAKYYSYEEDTTDTTVKKDQQTINKVDDKRTDIRQEIDSEVYHLKNDIRKEKWRVKNKLRNRPF